MRRTQFCFLLVTVVLIVAGSSRAVYAQSGCQVHADEEARRSEAREQFQRGQGLFDGNDFTNALAAFECSFRNVPHPSTLYNIARAAELSGNFSRALDAWRGYLQMSPDAEDRAEIEQRIVALEAASAAQNQAQGTATTQQSWTPPSPTPAAAAAPNTWETPDNVNVSNVYNPQMQPGQEYQMVETTPPSPWRRYAWYLFASGAGLALIGLVLATPLLPAAAEANATTVPYDPSVDGVCENLDAYDQRDDGYGGTVYERNNDVYRVAPGCWISGAALAGAGAAAMIGAIFIWAFAERGGSRVVTRTAGFSPSLIGREGDITGIGGNFTLRF